MARSTRQIGAEGTPRIKAGLVGPTDADRLAFAAFAQAIRDELAPRGVLESIHVDQVILAAWRLEKAIEAERVGVLEGLGADSSDLLTPLDRDLRRQTDREGRRLARALDDLSALRRRGWGQAVALDTTLPNDEVDVPEGPFAIADEFPGFADDSEAETDEQVDDAPLPGWSDRLVFDPNVSGDSPVVRGTWVTVSQVVSRIVDGETWADILRSHPELNEDDLRACLAFAHEQETDEGRSAYLP